MNLARRLLKIVIGLVVVFLLMYLAGQLNRFLAEQYLLDTLVDLVVSSEGVDETIQSLSGSPWFYAYVLYAGLTSISLPVFFGAVISREPMLISIFIGLMLSASLILSIAQIRSASQFAYFFTLIVIMQFLFAVLPGLYVKKRLAI